MEINYKIKNVFFILLCDLYFLINMKIIQIKMLTNKG